MRNISLCRIRLLRTLLAVLALLLLSNLVFAQSSANADAAARDAVLRLEAVLGGNSSVGTQSTPQPPVQVTRGGAQPRWVDEPYSAYNRERFIAAVGSAANRQQAEARAFSALVAIFGQSVRSDFSVATMYTEAVNRGVVSVSDTTSIRDRIVTAASMDNLVGAEIGSVWDSTRGTIYAIAYMDKTRTISIYTDMIIINNRNIEMLTTMSNAEKNTLDGYARFRLASQIAGINANYAAVISQVGGSAASLNLRSADFYNLEATNIIRAITVTVNVTNDRANRVQDAFARVLSSEGLRTRGNNPRYTLDVRLTISELTSSGSEFIFCQIEGSANLIDNSTGASLIPFSFQDREGHASFSGAEARAFTSVEMKIAQDYPLVLREYLSSLLPNN